MIPDFIIRLIAQVIFILVVISSSFIGGCIYEKKKWDEEKVTASEMSRNLEQKDAKLGHRKVEQIAEDKILLSDAKRLVAEAGKDKKFILAPECIAKLSVVEESKQKGIQSEPPKNLKLNEIRFTSDFVSVYDLSIHPYDVELRGRPVDSSFSVEVNAGTGLIEENNFTCAAEIRKLEHLQERICEKQKTFDQPLGKFCK